MNRLKRIVKVLASLIALSVLFTLGFQFPEIRQAWMRQRVADHVVEVHGTEHSGGGTGFQIEAPSGLTYIVTNSHVCEMAQKDGKDKNFLLVKRQEHWMKRSIIKISNKSDLCLLEGLPGLSGLKLGTNPQIGEKISVIGHPRLGPITMTEGEVVAMTDVRMLHHIMPTGSPWKDRILGASNEDCSLPKNRIVKDEVSLLGLSLGEVPLCIVEETNALQTNVVIFGGNSGSPVVDDWGRVIGVIFAANSNTNWGFAVNLDQLKEFIFNF